MPRLALVARIAALTLAVSPALAGEGHAHGTPSKPPASAEHQEKCAAHGVAKTLCTRCNPKLAAVYKAKGDWCAEHERPESQCVLCHPELAKKGVK